MFIFCIALGFSFNALGQDTIVVEIDTDTCVHRTTSIQELRQMQGYKGIDKVYLVSFSEKPEDEIGEMPMKDGLPDMSQMFEKIALEGSDRDSLLLILHNYANITGIETGATCFDPHNGIIFTDKKGKIIGHLAVCFGCRRFEAKWMAPVPEFCKEKWLVLQRFFSNKGIKFGLDYAGRGVLVVPIENH